MGNAEVYKETKLGLFPESWDLIKAKDFCKKVTDGTHDTPQPNGEGYFLVTSKNLTENGIDFSECYYISERDYNQINQRSKVEQYDILFGMIGTVGNTTIVTQKEVDFAIKNVGLFKLDGDLERAKWLKNYLSSHIFTNYLKRQQAGTTQQFVGLGFLRKTPIIVPHTEAKEIDWQQIKAVNFCLSKVDEAIEATQNSIKSAEKLKKALMQNLLSGKLKPDGTWRKDDEFYVDEKFGKVPIGWELKKLREVCLCAGEYGANASAIEYTEGNYRYIRITDIDDYGNLITENKAGINEVIAKNYLLKNNDFLFARTGDTVGKSLLYKESMGKAAYAGYLIKFTFNQDLILPEYFNIIARSDFFEAFKVAMKRVGAKPNINSREYGSFKFIIPNQKKEQEEILERFTAIFQDYHTKQIKTKTLQRLKKSLMQNLLTGRVRVDIEEINKILSEQ